MPEQLLEQRLLVRVEFGLCDGVGDPVVEVEARDAELFAAVLVNELHGRAVFFGALEVVARDVAAEDALRQVVVLEQRRAGEADEGRIRQGEPHVARELAGLRAVRLVGNHDDVVARAVWLARVHVLIELVDQAEDVAVVFLQQRLQLLTGTGARRLFVCDAAADEGPVNLAVEIVAVGHQQEGELRGNLPPHLLGEERHGVGLAAALRVPEHAQLAEVGMG